MKKGIIRMILLGVAVRVAMLAGAGEAVSRLAGQIQAEGAQMTATLRLDMGGERPAASEEPVNSENDEGAEAIPVNRHEIVTVPVVVTAPPTPEPTALPQAETGEIRQAVLSSGVSLRNDTSFEPDLDALSEEGLSLTLQEGEPQILIIHTHSSEAYTPDPFHSYEASDVSRTEDIRYNVVRVGDELTEKLSDCGLEVLHDREIYDYPSYTGSYSRSGEAVERYLAEYPSLAIVIDLHRDAIGSGDVIYKTQAEVPGQSSAQVMLLVGTGENGLYHPNWRENLKLALYMQNAMDERYPTLARPIALKKERYNQQLTTGSLILEVGSSGNTLPEALLAVDLFAEAVGPALAKLIS